SGRAFLGILCWEEQGCPRGLVQLEEMIGNSTNPATYSFPVRFERVPGANLQSVVLSPNQQVLHAMIESANRLVDQGAKAITTSCGFNAIFQKELANVLGVPVFTSSLLQIPLIRAMLGTDSRILVITASSVSLTETHFSAVGVTDLEGIVVAGLEQNREWRKIFEAPQVEINIERFRDDLIELATSFANDHQADALLLECTDLPPFAEDIRKATRLPVFDFVSLVKFVDKSINFSAQ
ncbi:MAG TPA: hypothetical protein VNQ76_00240, partial [Planctomicrobium sp.]|nr:hypothetical protein [Planctomicrobium sp.]